MQFGDASIKIAPPKASHHKHFSFPALSLAIQAFGEGRRPPVTTPLAAGKPGYQIFGASHAKLARGEHHAHNKR